MSGRFGRKAVFNAAMLSTLASLVSYASGLLVGILIARSLGPTEYGKYAYVVWLSGLMIALGSSGFNASAMRFISEYVGAEQPATSAAIHRRLRRQVLMAIGAACMLLTLIWPWVRPQGTESASATLLLIVIVGFSAKAQFMFESAAAKGYGHFWIDAAVLSLLAIVNAGGVVVLWKLHSELDMFLGWFALLSVAHLVLVVFLVQRRKGVQVPAAMDNDLLDRLSRHVRWGIVLSVVGVLGGRSFETFLLNSHVGAREVGFFSIAAMLTRSGVDLLAGGLSSVMIPVMSHAFGGGGTERLQRVFVNATRYYQFVGLVLGGVGFFGLNPR